MENINIWQIFKAMDYPYCEELYSPFFGKVSIIDLPKKDEKHDKTGMQIKTSQDGEYLLDEFGRFSDDGDVMIFPSKEMRDWRKFQWKKGDLLHRNGNLFVFFNRWTNDHYTEFEGCYQITRDGSEKRAFHSCMTWNTDDFSKCSPTDTEAAKRMIEQQLGGKLNLETLELEHPQTAYEYEVGKLYYFNLHEDGQLDIVGQLIAKNEDEDTLTFGDQLELNVEHYETEQQFDLVISIHPELRPATDEERERFENAYGRWLDSQKKPFKTFDKVLVRNYETSNWLPAIFIRERKGDGKNMYNALTIHTGRAGCFAHCIPYEGHENIAFRDYDIENLPL